MSKASDLDSARLQGMSYALKRIREIGMHRRTKATMIKPHIRQIVFMRDNGKCIFCGRDGNPEAHIISRAQGGLGIEENIVTVCRSCHDAMDNGAYRNEFVAYAKSYIKKNYGSDIYERVNMIYRKGKE